MVPIKVEFKHYKKLEGLSFSFNDTNCFWILRASNDKGKTSFINGLKAILTAKDDTSVKVTNGEKEGSITLEFEHEGQHCIGKFDFTDTSASFTLVTGKISTKKVSEIRDFFNYQSVTAERFINMGNNEKDRKEQRNLFLDLLPVESKAKLLFEEDLFAKAYASRTKANSDVDIAEKLAGSQLTEKEVEILSKQEEYQTEKENLKIRKEEFDKLETKKGEINKLISDKEAVKTTFNTDQQVFLAEQVIQSNLSRIDLLKAEIKKLEEDNVEKQRTLTERKEMIRVKIEEINKEIETEGLKKKEYEKLQVKLTVDETRVKELDTLISSMSDLSAKAKLAKENQSKLDELKAKASLLDDQVKKHSAECKRILREDMKPINNMIVRSDGLYYQKGDLLVPFNEKQVGTAETYKITIQLLLELNKTSPIILMGRCESLDDENLAIVNQTLVEYNKTHENKAFLIAEMVERKESDLEIIAYEEL